MIVMIASLWRSADPASVGLEVVKGNPQRFSRGRIGSQPREPGSTVALSYLRLNAIQTKMTIAASGDCVYYPWIHWTFRNEFSAALLRHRDESLLPILAIDEAEMHIVELHAADLGSVVANGQKTTLRKINPDYDWLRIIMSHNGS